MKKKILIILLVLLLIGLVIGTMYLIDKKRMRDNKPVVFSTWGSKYAPPAIIGDDKIVLNPNNQMVCIEFAVETQKIEREIEELQNLQYPSEITLSRALDVYVEGDTKDVYDELHDICLVFSGNDKNFTIQMAIGEEPLTDYMDPENKIDYQYSLISGNEVAILHNDNMDAANNKVYYTCLLEYNDIYFVIETINLTQDEVITLVKSIFECNMQNIFEKEINKTEFSFFATVIESKANYIIVQPNEGSKELKSSDKFSIGLGENNDALYEVGTNIKITYDGAIMETYPAKINASKIEIKSTDNFELVFKGRKDLGIKTILSEDETDKYLYNIFSFAGDVYIIINNIEYPLRDALLNNKITMDEIIAQANIDAFENKKIKVDSFNDGGTNIYYYDGYNIIKYHITDGERDVYIGASYMSYDIKDNK